MNLGSVPKPQCFRIRQVSLQASCLLLCASALLSNGCAGRTVSRIEPAAREYDAVAQYLIARAPELMRKHNVPGVSIAIIDDQRIVWTSGFGYADVAGKKPATPETVYRVGALTKPVTALALAQMQATGQMDLDQPLTTYLPEFSIQCRFPNAPPVTPRNMLTHHSGMPCYHMKDEFRSVVQPESEVIAALKDEYLTSAPETVFAYSYLAYAVLGYTMERVTGEDYGAYVERTLLKPAGMTTATFHPDRRIARLLAKGYRKGVEQQEIPARDPASYGLYASVLDMSDFAKLLFAQGVSGTKDVVRPEAVAETLKYQNVNIPYDGGYRIGLAWNLTWPDLAYMGHVAWHSGWHANFHSFMALAVDHKVAVVAVGNADIANAVVKDLVKEALQRAVEVKTGIAPPPAGPEPPTTPEMLESLPGYYVAYLGLISVERAHNSLRAKAQGASADLVMKPDGSFSFQYRLAGVLPINLPMLDDYCFYFHKLGDCQMLSFREDPWESMGQRIEPVPIPEAWVKRVGRYELTNRGDNLYCVEDLRIERKGDFLLVSVKLPVVHAKDLQLVLLPLSDTDGVAAGMGRHQGDRIDVITVNGEEHVRYSGYEFRRVSSRP